MELILYFRNNSINSGKVEIQTDVCYNHALCRALIPSCTRRAVFFTETASDDNDITMAKEGGNMKIGIIGAGKVGVTLGLYLTEHEIPVTGYYSRTYEHAVEAAEHTQTKAYQNITELLKASDTLFITTPDGEISKVWDCIAGEKLSKKIICHFSGSLSSNVFSGIGAAGAFGCSIHPMYAFSDKFTAYRQFHTACLTMEGHPKALDAMSALFGERLGHRIYTVKSEDKIKYHAAAAFASNYMAALFQASMDLLESCGFSKDAGKELLSPIIKSNVETMLKVGTKNALTGPIERNDIETVAKHLDALSLDEEDEGLHHGNAEEWIYRSLGLKLLEIAKEKHPESDYSKIEKMLMMQI